MTLRPARLEKAWSVSPRVKAFRLHVLGEEPFSFIPGQWVNFHLPIQAQNPQRAYSIASPPNGGREFETAITRVEGGPGSTFFHEAAEGAVIPFEGPAGRFVLREPQESGAVFVATGTGYTPFRSMLPHLLEQGCDSEIILIFGVRSEVDILFKDELETLALKHSNFRFIPTLSRPGEDWKGERGYVQVQVDKLLRDKTGLEAYVCGLKAMVNDVRKKLLDMGFDRKRVFFEKYD